MPYFYIVYNHLYIIIYNKVNILMSQSNNTQPKFSNEDKIKYLEFLQNIINRMASNCFLIKGWSISLISALFVFSSKDNNPIYIFSVFIPLIGFFILDGYFLYKERQFRDLYDKVVKDYNKEDLTVYEINIDDIKLDEFKKILLSESIYIFHLILFISVLISILIYNFSYIKDFFLFLFNISHIIYLKIQS